MTEFHLDSERFPDVARGPVRWSRDEAAHLEECAECRLEWSLVRAAHALGRTPSERIAPDSISAAVAARLESAPRSSATMPSMPARWILGIAAAAAIVCAVVLTRGEGPSGGNRPVADLAVLHELDGLTPAELEAVLEAMPPAADEAMHVDVAPIGELSAQDLERMLQSME